MPICQGIYSKRQRPIRNTMRLLLSLICAAASVAASADDTRSSRFDNSVVGTPVISCERDRIRVEVATVRPFAGKIFVKGEYANQNCVRSYINGMPVPSQEQQLTQEHSMGDKSSSIEHAESKDEETHLDSSLWVGNQQGSTEEGMSPLPVPEQANRFTTNDEVLTRISQQNRAKSEQQKLSPGQQPSASNWSGYGGVSSTPNRSASQFLGAFGGSRGEGTAKPSAAPGAQPNLKIYSKSKTGSDDLLTLEYPGPQGLVAENCPLKCEPCACPLDEEPQERKRRNTNNVELSIPLGTCNAKRDRKLSPPSLVVSFVAVISFHESFITKLDRAYHIQCAYTESNRTISTQLDVGMTAPTDLNSTASPPVCSYHISSVDGKLIQNVRVGDRVKHEWSCVTAVPLMYTMLIHSCFVEDGSGQRYEVIDQNGCSLDRYILDTPSYTFDGMTASVDAFMMKFPDKSSVDFQCAIKVCSKLDTNCTITVPPDCSLERTRQRKRRDTVIDSKSMTLHANTLTVFDADIAQDIPEYLAYTQEPPVPPEFCFSIAGFGILVSASTFLTTVAIGVAVANLYMRSQSKW